MKPDPMDVYGLAYKLAMRYTGRGVAFEDLINAAMLGACIACRSFDPAKGALTTHSAYRIRDELEKLVYRRIIENGKQKRILPSFNCDTFELIEDTYYDEDAEDSSDLMLREEVNRKVKKLINKLTDRQSLAFKCYYYLNDFETYKYKYSSTEAQARKEASNVKVKIYKQIKELI
jgi:RNA polymerase sigma factor (sigma-70 family)